jgi:hypothetical protein
LRRLDPRKRLLLELFHSSSTATTAQMASYLGLSARTLNSLVDAGSARAPSLAYFISRTL